MIKIGDFASLFNVSIKTIRFYEEKGLLIPSYVDIYSGYRYYNEDNINTMTKILFLKDLGYSLDEIKYFDPSNIDSKINEYKERIQKLYENINTLNSLSNNEGRIDKMKTFINDENAIGKWHLEGVYKSKEDFYNKKSLDLNDPLNDDVTIKELYLMENGQEYWVISWTKGIIYICGNAYEIENNLMFVKFIDQMDKTNYKIVVYRKLDSERYSIDDIITKDNTYFEYIPDEKVVGSWKTIDIVKNIESFNPNNIEWKNDFYLNKLSFLPDGNVAVYFKNDIIKNTKYTKDIIIDLCVCDTASKYEIKTINSKDYLIIEWKSGDYVFGNFIFCYYVLEKM